MKVYERNPPFTRHDIPFKLRGEDRVIHYTLYLDDKDERHSNCWFNCNKTNCPGYGDDCDCQPELDQVEEMAVNAAIAADINLDGGDK